LIEAAGHAVDHAVEEDHPTANGEWPHVLDRLPTSAYGRTYDRRGGRKGDAENAF
jgi:hypothetical protein